MAEGAQQVHGITPEFLQDKPKFNDVIDDLKNYLRGAELIIHNAPFDVGFLNAEFALLGKSQGTIEDICSVTDTLVMARKKHPGQKNNLDALCKRYDVNNTQRELHGALLDAELLADVYLFMTGGQVGLLLDTGSSSGDDMSTNSEQNIARVEGGLKIISADVKECAAHEAILDKMGEDCIWPR